MMGISFSFFSGTLMPMLYRKKGTVLIAESGVSEADRLGQLIFMVSYDFKTSDLIVKIDEGKRAE